MLYRITFTLTDGTVKEWPRLCDGEEARGWAASLRSCRDVTEVRVEEVHEPADVLPFEPAVA